MAFLSGIAKALGKAAKTTGKPIVAGSGLRATAPKAVAKPSAVKNIGSTSAKAGKPLVQGSGLRAKVK